MAFFNRYCIHRNLIGYSTNDDTITMNVLKEHWPIHKYRATLGHKVNHSFKRANTDFGSAIHPRYGPIRTIVSNRRIRKGEQLLCDYQYPEDSAIPRWYEKVYVAEMGKPWPGKDFYDESPPG